MIILKKICDTYIILQGFSRSSIFIITFFAEKAYFASKLQNSAREKNFHLDYVLRGSDQRARASMRVQAIGVFVSYVTATG